MSNNQFYRFLTGTNYESHRVKGKVWHVEQETMSRILDDIAEASNVLDIPVGTGRFIEFYKERGINTFGFDSSEDMINEAKKKIDGDSNNISFKIGDATSNLPYDNEFFDLVVCFRFLQGTISKKDGKDFLKEVVRVSNKYVVIEMSERKSYIPRLFKPRSDWKISGNLYQYEVQEIFKNAGLNMVKKYHINNGKISKSYAYLCKKI